MEIELWLLCATLAIVFLWATRRSGAGRMPPGPTPLPVVGNLLSLRHGNLHHTLVRLARVHGPVMTLKLGLTTAVVVSSRDAAEEAFTKHDRRLAARAIPDAARALGFSDRSMIWLPSSDPLWKSLRGVVATNVFSPRGLAAARGVRERKVRDLVGYFRGRAGREVDFGQAVYGGALNLVSSAFCSVDVVDVGGESAQGVRELVLDLVAVIAKPNVSDLVPFLRPLDLQGWRRWSAIRFGKIFLILDGIIDRRMAVANGSTEKQGDFLDSLLELVSTGKLARGSLTTILSDVIMAGSDTVSLTIEWALAELLRNQSVMAKARAEIQSALGGKVAVDETDAVNLPYLLAVVKEVMRLHPVAPILLPHRAVEDGVEIGSYDVPKGSTVIFNAWAIMRDPAAWERPDEFVPERFLDMANQLDFRGKAFEFIPFGSGRRLCPGVPMAERVVPFILASLLHAFEWRLPDGVSAEALDVSERFTTANVLNVPLKVVPVVIA
jgi:cytochrome P450